MASRRHLAVRRALSSALGCAAVLAVVLLIALPSDVAAQTGLHPADAGAIPTPVLHRCSPEGVADSAAVAADSLGMDDDSIPASALPPESGMVLIDRTGHEVHTVPPLVPAPAGAAASGDRLRCASARTASAVAASTL